MFEPTAGAHCMIFPKLCVLIELVETIKKVSCNGSGRDRQFLFLLLR